MAQNVVSSAPTHAPLPRAHNRDDRSEVASKRRRLIEDPQQNWLFAFTLGNGAFEQCNAGAAVYDVVVEQSRIDRAERQRKEEEARAMPPPTFRLPSSAKNVQNATQDESPKEPVQAVSKRKPLILGKAAKTKSKNGQASTTRRPLVLGRRK